MSRMIPGWRPACMTNAEYDEWHRAAVSAQTNAGCYIPVICHDCTREFRRASEVAGVCNKRGPQATTAERREAIAALRAQGLSWGQVGARLGLTTRQAQNYMRDRSGYRAASRARAA